MKLQILRGNQLSTRRRLALQKTIELNQNGQYLIDTVSNL
jgi:hypothetical protein